MNAALATVAANPQARKVIGDLGQQAAGGVGGAIGGLFGHKGAQIGKKVGRALGGAARKFFGFQQGGVVGRIRHPPVRFGMRHGGRVPRRF